MTQTHELVQAFDGFVFRFEPQMPIAPRVVIESGFREMPAETVVNLPRDELRMIAQRARHFFHEPLGIIPIDIAVQTNRSPRAAVFDAAGFIHGQNLRMRLRKPRGRSSGGRAENDLNFVFAQHIHHALKPAEIKLTIRRFAKTPGKFADADDVEAGGSHKFRIALQLRLGIFGGATKGEDPLFGIIINAEIHKVPSGLLRRH